VRCECVERRWTEPAPGRTVPNLPTACRRPAAAGVALRPTSHEAAMMVAAGPLLPHPLLTPWRPDPAPPWPALPPVWPDPTSLATVDTLHRLHVSFPTCDGRARSIAAACVGHGSGVMRTTRDGQIQRRQSRLWPTRLGESCVGGWPMPALAGPDATLRNLRRLQLDPRRSEDLGR
jgi:hypothetical protein